MKLALVKGSTDVTVYIFIKDSSVTTGAGLTGLVFDSSGLVASQVRPLVARVGITLVTQTVAGAHSAGGFVEVDATNMPGVYRLDLPDTVSATGVNSVVVMLKGAANMAPVFIEIQLTTFDLNTDTVGTSTTIGSAGIDLIWDEPLAGHNVGGSAGKRLKTIPSIIIREDTAQGPGTGNNQIQLDAGASSVDGTFDPSLIFITNGTGAGQGRNILQYNGTTKTATVDRSWKINPDATSEFIIFADAGREHVNEGLAQAGTINTITLNVLASSTDDVYRGQIIFLRSGTGEDQIGTVIAYNGTTKVATIHRDWAVVPDTTTGYVMLPLSPVELTPNSIDAIYDELTSGHSIAGSFGKLFIDISADTSAIGIGGSGLTELGGMSDNMKTEIKAEVSGILITDTIGELNTVPNANSSLADKINFTFEATKNKFTQTNDIIGSGTQRLFKDDSSTILGTFPVVDDGTIFTRGKGI